MTELFSYHLDVQRIDEDENKCVFDLVAGGTTEEEMMRADVIAGEVGTFSVSHHLKSQLVWINWSK